MVAGGKDGGIFLCHLADRFLLSQGIFVPKEMIVAFVVPSQYILLFTYIHTLHHADSFLMNLRKNA
jgi:hypothetical protein